MMPDENYRPFSQRSGLSEIPPQLKLGEVSPELRRLLDFYISEEIEREESRGFEYHYFSGEWERVAKDLHVLFLGNSADSFENRSYQLRKQLEAKFAKLSLGPLFDLVEFFLGHKGCSAELKSDLAGAFVRARAAYRVVDGIIVAIGTDQQAEAFECALRVTQETGALAARQHLILAGSALRNGNWAGSVRESIHAVEAMARKIVPGTDALGPALTQLEARGYLHGGLKKAFGNLYGYASDEQGVRHPLVLRDVASVDEADALFMLGACASFVSYLIARDRPA